MKNKFYRIAFVLMASSVFAQETTTKTTTVNPDGSTVTTIQTTTGTGTITEYVPGTKFIMMETTGPVIYRYGKRVTYVTRSGKLMSESDIKTRIKVGIPASVNYVLDGDTRVIIRVVLED